MMTVNAFWFGFLIAVVSIIVLVMVAAFFGPQRSEREVLTEEKLQELLHEATGDKYLIVSTKGFLFAQRTEDDKDD